MPDRRLTQFETRRQPAASFPEFLKRMAVSLAVAGLLIGLSLVIGMAGYQGFEGMSVVDAYLNASMLLGGMGPVGELHTTAGKIFAGTYALYCGVVLIVTTGIILAPIVHRVLHAIHAEDGDDDTSDDTKE
jgi:hypothetical protein